MTEYVLGGTAHLCFEISVADFLSPDRFLSKTPCVNEDALDGAVYEYFR